MTPTVKPFWQSKTLIFNALVIALFACGFVLDNAGVLQLDPRMVVLFSGLIGLGNLGLRLVSNTAIRDTPAALAAAPPPH